MLVPLHLEAEPSFLRLFQPEDEGHSLMFDLFRDRRWLKDSGDLTDAARDLLATGRYKEGQELRRFLSQYSVKFPAVRPSPVVRDLVIAFTAALTTSSPRRRPATRRARNQRRPQKRALVSALCWLRASVASATGRVRC